MAEAVFVDILQRIEKLREVIPCDLLTESSCLTDKVKELPSVDIFKCEIKDLCFSSTFRDVRLLG